MNVLACPASNENRCRFDDLSNAEGSLQNLRHSRRTWVFAAILTIIIVEIALAFALQLARAND